MTKGVLRLPSNGPRQFLFDLFSSGRAGPRHSLGFTTGQIAEIRRTVNRTAEVMVKVTGGGRRVGAVAAHLSYISREGELKLHTDEGIQVSRESHRALLEDWHLDLSAGQYRKRPDARSRGRGVKLVHNIVLSMPKPTPADKVLAGAAAFAREKFWGGHRYVMALHTHQEHPHVHLVVKAEDDQGRRLHIDKALLREWRQDFAQLMRDQGIAANATPRVLRSQGRRVARDASFRAQRRASSHKLREQVVSVVKELRDTGTVRDPARERLLQTRKAVVSGWAGIADRLDTQGEIALAGDVRYFAQHMPPVLTDRERLAVEFVRHLQATSARERGQQLARDANAGRSR